MKKPVNNLDDIIYYTAQECDVDEELVLNVHKNLWDTVRKLLSKPHQVGLGVHINTFLKFTLREGKIWSEWQKVKKWGHLPKTKKTRFYNYYDTNYYETLYNEYHRLKDRFEEKKRGRWFEWNTRNKNTKSNNENG